MDTYRNRENSRGDYLQGRNYSGDRSRTSQSCSQLRGEDRRERDGPVSRSESGSRSRSRSIVSTNRDRIRCYKCREYDHFANKCPNSITDEEIDQDVLNQSTLQMLSQDNLVGSDMHESLECLNL